jgi:hypothetical protein
MQGQPAYWEWPAARGLPPRYPRRYESHEHHVRCRSQSKRMPGAQSRSVKWSGPVFEESSAHDLLPACIDGILKRALPISGGLKRAVAEFGGEFAIYATATSIPGVGLTREQVRRIADLGLSIDIDIVMIAED